MNNELTRRNIGCAYRVMDELGSGFLEKVYENALLHELRLAGIRVVQQFPIKVSYRGSPVGEFIADLLVEESVLVELKVAQDIEPVHLA